MDYGEDEALHFGAEYYPERHDCDTEFHLICARQRSGEEDRPVKKLTAEARFVAGRIRTLLDDRRGWDAASVPAGGLCDFDALPRQPEGGLCPGLGRAGRSLFL